MMEGMGFALKWIELIVRCISSVSYSVIINGKVWRNFKIKIWKVSWDFLPTFVNLQRRQLCATVASPRCGVNAEITSHVFRQYPRSIEIWHYLELQWVLVNLEMGMWEWLTWFFYNGSRRQCRLFCYALWTIWNERNKTA